MIIIIDSTIAISVQIAAITCFVFIVNSKNFTSTIKHLF